MSYNLFDGSVNLNTTDMESDLIEFVVARAQECGATENPDETMLDITACHCNGTPLDLLGLIKASEQDFVHDITGIHAHIDRQSGKLKDLFEPRMTQRRIQK